MGKQINIWSAEVDGAALSGELHRVLGVSHRQAKGLIDAGCVTINESTAKNHGTRLKSGDEIKVSYDSNITYDQLPRQKAGSDSEIKILWEDKDLVFVDKPAGMLSVPTEHSNDDSLADALAEFFRQRGIKNPRIYIVHRLDRYTTGTLVFAKTPEALNGLRELFHDHRIERVYKAILVGELPENNGTLHDKLAERTRRLKMTVIAKRTGGAKPQGTKPAVTHYRVIERLPGHTVVELKLETGRRNQIRVQFAERGYPILGDHIYGKVSPIIDRQALHAELLGLRHPVTNENVTVQSRLPEDMEMALRKLRTLRRVDRARAGIKGEEGIYKPRIPKERKQERITRAKRFSKSDNTTKQFHKGSQDDTNAPGKDRRFDSSTPDRRTPNKSNQSAPNTTRQPEKRSDSSPRPFRKDGTNKPDAPGKNRRFDSSTQDRRTPNKSNQSAPNTTRQPGKRSDSSPRPFRKDGTNKPDAPGKDRRLDSSTPDRQTPKKSDRSAPKTNKQYGKPQRATSDRSWSGKKTSQNSKNPRRTTKYKP